MKYGSGVMVSSGNRYDNYIKNEFGEPQQHLAFEMELQNSSYSDYHGGVGLRCRNL